ncbi:MAG: phospholipase D family protein [Desulfovibrio sp.]|jgi:phosphatidylserine/phosphatidylglycerophosphate/cardiolipin synthase-like enzyme|nr:phospholipase D family protein [Desulfovibrio sp.]
MQQRFSLCLFALFLALLPATPVAAPAAGAGVETAFSPAGGALALTLSLINKAEKSILVAAFSFTSTPVAKALTNAARRGVRVRVVADKETNDKGYTAVVFLANQGIPVRLNGAYNHMHNKFMVADGRHVQTGSFNYTRAAAEKNAENVLVVRNDPVTAAKYTAEWERLWNEGEEFKKRR